MPRHAPESLLNSVSDKLKKRHGGWMPMVKIYEKIVPLVGPAVAEPGAILIDDEINVLAYGLVSTTYRFANFGHVIEKPDGNGGWVPTISGSGPDFPGKPAQDPGTYAITTKPVTSPMKRPYAGFDERALLTGDGVVPEATPDGSNRSVGSSAGDDWWNQYGASPLLVGSPDPEDRVQRLRVFAQRAFNSYTPEEQAELDALGYRLRVMVHAINMVVWEKEVPLPPQEGVVVLNEEIDLADYGLASDHDRFRFVAEFRRNGKTIRSPLRESVPGEVYDPPPPVVNISTIGMLPDNHYSNNNNNPDAWSYYGINSGHRDAEKAPVVLGSELGYCAESVKQKVRVMAWRMAYVPDSGGLGMPATHYKNGEYAYPQVDLGDWTSSDPTDPHVYSEADRATKNYFVASSLGPSFLTIDFVEDGGAGGNPACWGEVKPGGGAIFHITPNVTTHQDLWNVVDGMDGSQGFTMLLRDPTQIVWQGQYTGPVPFRGGYKWEPMPANYADGCTLVIRLLAAPPKMVGEYPFAFGAGANDLGIRYRWFNGVSATPERAAHLPTADDEVVWVNRNGTGGKRFMFSDKELAFRDEIPAPGGGGAQPYDIPMSVEGQALGDEVIQRIVFTRAVSFEANFANSQGAAATVDAANPTVFSIKKNGVEIGQVTFAANSAVATFTSTGGEAQAFAPGDVLTVVAPTVMTALANIAITLAGTR